MPDTETALDLDFDPKTLRAKYRQERDKRLRVDGNDQYIEVKGDFAHYVDDPYVEKVARDPLKDDVEMVIIGGGFGGLLAGARLHDAGFRNIRIIEKGGDFGGTWYWNRYPGAACDIESYVYLPLLEETGYLPVEKYSQGSEILEHARRIARKYDLYDNACLQTEVTGMAWDNEAKRWNISTNRGDEMRARYVVLSNGPLHRPKLPGIKGIDSYQGHSFHTSRWDYAYTGGDASGGLTGLKGKRVGVIGTGATAVQCVPHLAETAEQLFVFQRTPSSIDVRNNQPTPPDWDKDMAPGWHQARMDNFNTLVSGGYAPEDLVNDGWTSIIRNLIFLASKSENKNLSPEKLAEMAELADFQKMEEVRARVDSEVNDPATAEALKPWYRQFCKRPCFHDEYLAAFNRPNVELVDTDGKGIDEITQNAVIANGQTHEVDCLIFATGFEVGTDYTRRSGYDLVGETGKTLSETWADGIRSLHGMSVHGFPNAFIMGTAQAGFTANYPHLLSEQARHIAYIASEAKARQARTVQVSQSAEEDWVQTIIKKAVLRRDFLEECTPGYYNNEGKPGDRSEQSASYGGGSNEYFKILDEWRASGDLQGMEIDA